MEPGGAHAIRPAQAADLPLLAEIEGEADQLFSSVFGDIDWDPPSDGEWRARQPGFLLVAGDPAVGFAHVLFIDDGRSGAAHLEQLCVHPAEMGRGIGTALLEAACERARAEGHTSLSLSTFVGVPWNAPFYAARGFTQVTEPLPFQERLVAQEEAMGLHRHGPRVVMSRPLDVATALP